jgi:hypothetical protein
MKRIFNLSIIIMLTLACHKKDLVQPDGTLTSPDFVYNVALKGFQPQASVSGSIDATINMGVIYYYLQRENKQDTLIQVDFPEAENRRDYPFEVKAVSWAGINLTGVSAPTANAPNQGTSALTIDIMKEQ